VLHSKFMSQKQNDPIFRSGRSGHALARKPFPSDVRHSDGFATIYVCRRAAELRQMPRASL